MDIHTVETEYFHNVNMTMTYKTSSRSIILTSMIMHMVTFITLALGTVYESNWLIFVSLITLLLGLFFGKEMLERLDYEEDLADFQQNVKDGLEKIYGDEEIETSQRSSRRADMLRNPNNNS